MTEITWSNEKRKLSELIEWEKNPRQLSKHAAEHIQKSIEKFGVVDPLIINLDNKIVGGHQRKLILKLITDPEFEVDVRIPDRLLTDEEVEELNIRLNKNVGAWNWDTLANEFEVDDLLDWGFSEEELIGMSFDAEVNNKEQEIPEMELAAFEGYDYIVLVFKDQLDWLAALDILEIEKVRQVVEKGKDKVGLGRIIDGAEALRKLSASV